MNDKNLVKLTIFHGGHISNGNFDTVFHTDVLKQIPPSANNN